jgi:outer membrane lipoprotein SlyB
MNSKLPSAALVAIVSVTLAGCTFPSSRRVIPANQANVMQRAETGVVTQVREVNIEGQRSNLGMYGGGIIGASAASGGHGVGGALGQAAAGVAGAVVGQATEEAITRKHAQEITIRLDDGSTVVVTQEAASGIFQDGDRVRVLNGGGGARVSMVTDGL